MQGWGSVWGTVERPAGLAFQDCLTVSVVRELMRELARELRRLVTVQEPVGADQSIEEEARFVQANDPRAAKSVNLFHAHPERFSCGDVHGKRSSV